MWVTLLSAPHSAELQINPSHSFTEQLIAGCSLMWSQQIQQKEDESCLAESPPQICLNFKFTSEVSSPKPLTDSGWSPHIFAGGEKKKLKNKKN